MLQQHKEVGHFHQDETLIQKVVENVPGQFQKERQMTNHEAFVKAINIGFNEKQVFNKREVEIEVDKEIYSALLPIDLKYLAKNGITVKEQKQ